MDTDTIIIVILLIAAIITEYKINKDYKSYLRNKLQECDRTLEFYVKLDFYLWALETDQIQLKNPPEDLYEQAIHYLQSSEIERLMVIHSKSKEELTEFYALMKDRLAMKKKQQQKLLRKIYGNPKKREEPE